MNTFKKRLRYIVAIVASSMTLFASPRVYSQSSVSSEEATPESIRVTNSDSSSDSNINEKVAVTFTSFADQPVQIHSIEGQWVGYSKGPVPLEMLIDVATAKASIDPATGQVDVPTLLRHISRHSGTDGKSYCAMRVLRPVALDDGRTILADSASTPSQILLNFDDFRVTKVVFPVGASAAINANTETADSAQALNQHLQDQGLTDRSVPASLLPQNAGDASNDVTLQTQDDDDEDLDTGSDYTTYGRMIRRGNPFRAHFLSAPVCDCLGGSCGIKSGFGARKTFQAGDGWASTNHRGIDIKTAARKDGTPVVAAAPGRLEIPIVRGRPAHKVGDPVLPNQLWVRGYGNTVRVTHGNGFETQYSHLNSVPKGLRWGQPIRRGQRIGTMGHTGHAHGTHLHFGVVKNGHWVNPKFYLLGDDREGLLNTRFFEQSCKHPVNNSDIDQEMHEALKLNSAVVRDLDNSRANAVN